MAYCKSQVQCCFYMGSPLIFIQNWQPPIYYISLYRSISMLASNTYGFIFNKLYKLNFQNIPVVLNYLYITPHVCSIAFETPFLSILLNIMFHALVGRFQLELFILITYFSTVVPFNVLFSFKERKHNIEWDGGGNIGNKNKQIYLFLFYE